MTEKRVFGEQYLTVVSGSDTYGYEIINKDGNIYTVKSIVNDERVRTFIKKRKYYYEKYYIDEFEFEKRLNVLEGIGCNHFDRGF